MTLSTTGYWPEVTREDFGQARTLYRIADEAIDETIVKDKTTDKGKCIDKGEAVVKDETAVEGEDVGEPVVKIKDEAENNPSLIINMHGVVVISAEDFGSVSSADEDNALITGLEVKKLLNDTVT